MRSLDLAIREVGLDPPEPSDALFVERFWRMLQEADDYVHDEWDLPRRDLRHDVRVVESEPPPEPEPVPVPEPVLVALNGHEGKMPVQTIRPVPEPPTGYHTSCVGCGCPLDEQTKDCRNCAARHYMRAKSARMKAAREDRIPLLDYRPEPWSIRLH